MIETAVLFTVIFLLLILWYQKRKKQMSIFERLNIPGPKPHLISGNLLEYRKEGFAKCQTNWIKTYGNIVGYYLGSKPILLVSDPAFWKFALIKDFENFINRDLFISDGGIPHGFGKEILSLKEGSNWKKSRSILSPGFSTNKLKQTVPVIKDAIKEFLDLIQEKANNNEEFNIFLMFHMLTMDIIGRSVFGIRTNIQKNHEDIFVKNIKYLSAENFNSKFIFILLCFPELEFIFSFIRLIMDKIRCFFGLHSVHLLFNTLNAVIDNRKENKNHRQDLLQIMLDANISSEELKDINTDKLNASLESNITTDIKKPRTKLHYMPKSEVIANSALFMIAGYETTGTTLSFITHLLVSNPKIQEKVREEINSILQNEELSYFALSKMQYLQQVISEALRLYPPSITFTTRKASKTFTYKNFTIPNDMTIQHATWQSHRDSEIWENPNHFDPDRFSSERKESIDPFVYQPFGNGPRNCIGMRFAFIMIKLILASFLHSFKIVPANKTEQDPLELEFRLFQLNPLNGIYVKVVPL